MIEYSTESEVQTVVRVSAVHPRDRVAAAAQHHKTGAYHVSLTQEKIKIKIRSIVSTESVVLSHRLK